MTLAPLRCPPVIVVMGVSGAGKSTVGRALALALGREFHDADAFHPAANVARMRAGLPLTDTDRAPWLAALEVRIARWLASGTPAVLACSALRRAHRAALVPPEATPGDVAFVHLDVSPAVAAERIRGRRHHFMPVELLGSQFATLEEPRGALRVDGTAPVDAIVRQVRAALGC